MHTFALRARRFFNFSTLAIAEHNHKTLAKGVSKLLRAASKLNQDVKQWHMQTHLLIVGDNTAEVVAHAKATLSEAALKKIIAVESPQLKNS